MFRFAERPGYSGSEPLSRYKRAGRTHDSTNSPQNHRSVPRKTPIRVRCQAEICI